MARPSNNLAFFWGVKGRFHYWIALTFFVSVHQLHSSPHSLRTQYLVEQSCFPLYNGYFLSNPLVSTSLYLANTPRMWFRGGPFFVASPRVPWSCSNRTTTNICSFFIWFLETKFNLAPPTLGVIVNFKLIFCHHGISQPQHKRTGLHLTSTL